VFEVLIEHTAERDLKKLNADDFNRIITNITSLAENPRPHGCRKITGSESYWRIRIGNYRVIYEIDDSDRTVRVFRVRHRRDAYRYPVS
jgi:mRNA interferase RelE/StbE